MSNHTIPVVQITAVQEHPNADSLEIVRVNDYEYQTIVRKGDFKEGDLAIFVEPDYVVPAHRPEFSFLSDNGRKSRVRITTKRLRGLWSEGLLIPAKSHHSLGDDVLSEYEITRWEPPLLKSSSRGWNNEGACMQNGWEAPPPAIHIPVYDIENEKKYSKLIPLGEPVYYTTKIHGTNARFVYHQGAMHCGSRTRWRYAPGITLESVQEGRPPRVTPENTWWSALSQNRWIEEWCKDNPDVVLFGEIYGPTVQGHAFSYGLSVGSLGVRIFDIYEHGRFLSFEQILKDSRFGELKIVPVLYEGPHNRNVLMELAEETETLCVGQEVLQVREGIVIKLRDERYSNLIGRVVLKYVSHAYLLKG